MMLVHNVSGLKKEVQTQDKISESYICTAFLFQRSIFSKVFKLIIWTEQEMNKRVMMALDGSPE